MANLPRSYNTPFRRRTGMEIDDGKTCFCTVQLGSVRRAHRDAQQASSSSSSSSTEPVDVTPCLGRA